MFKRLVPFFVVLALAAGCKVGALGEAGADLFTAVTVSNDELIQVSQQMRAQGDAEAKVAPRNNRYAQRLDRLTRKHLNEDGLALNFKVYITGDVNANATADGSIRVYSGLMDRMTDNDLLVILGHEIGHVQDGDSLDKIRTAYTASAVRKGASAAGGVAGALSDSVLGDLLETVLNAQFSQSQESDADLYGYAFMKKYGYDTKAAVSALKKLDSLGASGGITASHPNSASRAEAIQARIDADRKQ
jgi:putative metalloprotease